MTPRSTKRPAFFGLFPLHKRRRRRRRARRTGVLAFLRKTFKITRKNRGRFMRGRRSAKGPVTDANRPLAAPLQFSGLRRKAWRSAPPALAVQKRVPHSTKIRPSAPPTDTLRRIADTVSQLEQSADKQFAEAPTTPPPTGSSHGLWDAKSPVKTAPAAHRPWFAGLKLPRIALPSFALSADMLRKCKETLPTLFALIELTKKKQLPSLDATKAAMDAPVVPPIASQKVATPPPIVAPLAQPAHVEKTEKKAILDKPAKRASAFSFTRLLTFLQESFPTLLKVVSYFKKEHPLLQGTPSPTSADLQKPAAPPKKEVADLDALLASPSPTAPTSAAPPMPPSPSGGPVVATMASTSPDAASADVIEIVKNVPAANAKTMRVRTVEHASEPGQVEMLDPAGMQSSGGRFLHDDAKKKDGAAVVTRTEASDGTAPKEPTLVLVNDATAVARGPAKTLAAAPPTEIIFKPMAKHKLSAWAELFGSLKYLGMGKDRQAIVQNLATMLNAGLPLVDALHTLQLEARSKPLRTLLKRIIEAVENGSPLWRAMEDQHFFSPHAIALVRIGEEAGNLAENMEYLALQQEKDQALRSKVKMAMIYPIIVMTLMFIVIIGLGMFVLPNLISVLYSLNVPLPLVTRGVIAFTNFFTEYGTVAVPGSIGGFILLIILAKFTPLKVVAQWMLFRIPGIGRLVSEATIARFGVILGGLLQAGVPLVDALSSLVEVTPVVAYKRFYKKLLEHISIGDSFSKSFQTLRHSARVLPVSVQQLVVTGEKSGSLAKILLKVADIYEKKANTTAEKLPVILEPMLLIFIGGLVGTIAFAIIVPIYSIVGSVGN